MAKKHNKESRYFITLAILLITAFGLWSLLQRDKALAPNDGPGQKYQVLKSGAGATIDFTNACRDLDAMVIKFVTGSGFKNIITDLQTRQVSRQSIEGLIKWENRHITIAIPTEPQLDSFTENLSNVLKKDGGRILRSRQDMIGDKSALRLDIGFEDTLEGESVTVVTHNIWLIMQSDTPVAPPEEVNEPLIPGTNPLQPKAEKSPASKRLGRLALVIDDFGLTMDGVADLMAIDQPLTFSILPYHVYSATIAREAVAHGKQVMLHLPMESIGGEQAEPTTILTSMADAQIITHTRDAVAAVPLIIGVNNHQGSKATADARVMQNVLSVLRERGLFFVDSRTSTGSIAYRTAKSMGMRATENERFIDNSSDVAAIKRELRSMGKLAIEQGQAVAIGHIRPHTVLAIRAMLPELELMGVKLVFVSELAR